jgi:flagellar biosynthesis chaperone FliJ
MAEKKVEDLQQEISELRKEIESLKVKLSNPSKQREKVEKM